MMNNDNYLESSRKLITILPQSKIKANKENKYFFTNPCGGVI